MKCVNNETNTSHIWECLTFTVTLLTVHDHEVYLIYSCGFTALYSNIIIAFIASPVSVYNIETI